MGKGKEMKPTHAELLEWARKNPPPPEWFAEHELTEPKEWAMDDKDVLVVKAVNCGFELWVPDFTNWSGDHPNFELKKLATFRDGKADYNGDVKHFNGKERPPEWWKLFAALAEYYTSGHSWE